ncbi:hypothetical protein SEA_CUCURBITA_134 [Gordonia phage Cucurbita]|uniref:Uncharacterized protein n=1 Tax=Gordonia phage Bachita TaxID=1838061 RepID=A0A160DFU6_9CAUD|nr:hypothetical protein BH772_gp075 [Gordonia phage Bachita]YP_009281288.1 hypothetical protein BIZ74_gp071 [Gordonia phage Cucurbita]ANA86811.1 hypothetical protein PBI_BACHITA_136 [Gordonia phage Bachita]AOE44221.1 hypothetical protein SEA_CUCURBITA_134 [Gordonia phage Cucurbita]QKY79711.1 hypothetical protein SEA_ENGINEER_135 [Gordonia Phage Engineer]
MADTWPENDEMKLVTNEIRIVYGIGEEGEPMYACGYARDGEFGQLPDTLTGLGMIKALELDYLERRGIIHGFDPYDAPEE